MSVISRASKTILDLTDGGSLTAYLSANQPVTQILDTNTGSYTPDWYTNHLVITPYVYIDQQAVALDSTKLTITWKRKLGSGAEVNLDSNTETVSGNILTVSANNLADVNNTSGQLTYIAHVSYILYQDSIPAHTKTATATANMVFTLIKSGDGKSISIVGEQVFKKSAIGSTYTPQSITLTAVTQNVQPGGWQYWNPSAGQGGQWVTYPGSVSGSTTLTVTPSDTTFDDNGIAQIRLHAALPNESIYDIFSVYKIQDGLVGQNAQTVFLTNENITFAGDKDGKVGAVTKTCNVVAYDGTTKTTPTVGTPSGAPTGMTVTVGSASNNEIPITITVADNATLGGAGEQSGTISIPVTAPVSTTLQIRWSKVNTGATGSQGPAGQDGVHGLNVATVYLYQRAASAPTAPSGELTYTFATGALSGTLGNWSQSVPSGSDPCYIILATASATTSTDTIASSEWTTPVLLVQNGADGHDGHDGQKGDDGDPGVDGYNQATVYLYMRKSGSAPSKPSSGQTYTFSTGALSTVPTGWSQSMPTVNGDPCYVVTAAAISRDATATISGWSDVVKLVEDGADGADAYVLTLYTPDGNIFTNGIANSKTSLDVYAQFYKGSSDISTAATSYYLWEKYNGSSWTTVQAEATGSSGYKYTVSASDVTGAAIYRCRAKDGSSGTAYYMTVTIIDKTDNYQSEIGSTGGNVFQNNTDNSSMYTRVWQNGAEVDALKSTTFSADDPTAPSSGNPFYYHIIDPDDATESGTVPVSPSLNDLWLDTSATPNVLKRYNGTSWVAVTNVHEVLLMRWSGSAWEDVTDNATYKHTLTYNWYRLDINGDPMDGGAIFATGKVIHVTSADVEGKVTFVCQTTDGALTPTLLSQTQFTIRDDTDILVSDTEPTDKSLNMLWLNTSVSPNVLKRWNGTSWVTVVDSGDIYTTINNSISAAQTDILDEVDTRIAAVTIDNEKFTILFGNTVGPGIQQDIGNVQTNLDNYQQGVSSYMRFDDSGTLTLGQTNNDFQTQLTNTKMSFLEGNSEVAYISNQSLFITNARITDTLSLGTNNGYGYFDWTVTTTGLGLKWRNPGYGGIKVTMRFNGITTVPANFQITNDYNNTVFTALNAEAGDGINVPFEWNISGIPERTAVTFTQASVNVSGYTRTGSPLTIVSDTTLTDIIIATAFVNVYTATT